MADENSPSGNPAANGESIGRPVSEPGPHSPAEADRGETATFDKQALLQSSYTPKIDGYTVAREISRGGQAVVYQATQQSTHRRVAVKVMLEGPYAGPAQRTRFDREVQILAALEHPHIVSVVDRGVTAEGAFYFVMEYVEGRSLDEHLAERRMAAEGPEEVKTALRLFLAVCDAVNAAHLRGVVHRDLKPSNIRVDPGGEPRILDFGLARTALPGYADADSQSPVTITGQFLGSLPWSSPEQAEGHHSLIDTRTDVYSLGVILYQILTGEFPYAVAGSVRKVLENIVQTQPSPPSKVIAARDGKKVGPHRKRSRTHLLPFSPALDAVVLKALAKKREDRYQSAGELSRDIANVLAGRPTTAAGIPRTRKWPKVALLAGGIAAVLAATVALTVYLVRPGKEPPDSGAVPEFPGSPFDAAEAKLRQQEAAKASGVPVERTLDLGDGVTMKLALIPSGTFLMGSPASESGRRTPEGPVHPVKLTKPFYLGVTEVTRGQFAAFVSDTGHKTEAEKGSDARSWRDAGFAQTDEHPVVNVSWHDTKAFCQWLSGKSGRQARLPTEAQWEYACRAGTRTRFSFSQADRDLHKYGNYADRSCTKPYEWKDPGHDDSHDRTAPVGSYEPNPWGLHDMHGNVWEWCIDRYRYDYYAKGETVDPLCEEWSETRVMRGGTWDAIASVCRSAMRGWSGPTRRDNRIGFRVLAVASGRGPPAHVLLPGKEPPSSPPRTRHAVGSPRDSGAVPEVPGWPFDATESKRRQQAASKASGVPVEKTLDLGDGVTMKFALIPSGTFVMGSPANERGRDGREGPLHPVKLTKPFYLAVTEVTRGQFAAFVAATKYKTDAEERDSWGRRWSYSWVGRRLVRLEGVSWRTPGFEQTDEHPVTCVNLNDTKAFLRWLREKTGTPVRLPTEAQWEYACRAGSDRAYQWGDDPGGGKGWCNAMDQTGNQKFPGERPFPWSDGYVYTAPVGSFRPNAWGLYDMHGNNKELCSDRFTQTYRTAAKQVDPRGPATGSNYVLRGGSWHSPPARSRSASRNWCGGVARGTNSCFRVAADVK